VRTDGAIDNLFFSPKPPTQPAPRESVVVVVVAAAAAAVVARVACKTPAAAAKDWSLQPSREIQY